MKDYYAKRWNLFFGAVIKAAKQGREFDEKAFGEELSKFEHAWTMKHTKYPVEPKKTKEIVPLGKYDYPLPRFEKAMEIYERWMKP